MSYIQKLVGAVYMHKKHIRKKNRTVEVVVEMNKQGIMISASPCLEKKQYSKLYYACFNMYNVHKPLAMILTSSNNWSLYYQSHQSIKQRKAGGYEYQI